MEQVPIEHLQCPICIQLPEKEVYQCRNGHTVCKQCSDRLQNCPQCRVPFEGEKIRNRLLETLLENLEIKCTYHQDGCNQKILRKDMGLHKEACAFRPIEFCKFVGFEDCNFKNFRPNSIFKHIVDYHKVDQHEGQSIELILGNFVSRVANLKDNMIWPEALKINLSEEHGHLKTVKLILFTEIQFPTGDFSVACFHVGNSPLEHPTYTVDLEMKVQRTTPKNKWKWTGEPASLNEVQLLTSNPCIRIPLKYLTDHIGREKDFDLRLEVSISRKSV